MVNLDISTNDPDEARLKVSEIYCDHDLRVLSSRTPFQLNHIGATVDGLGVYLMSYGTNVQVRPGVLEDFALVQIPLRGKALDIIEGQKVETTSKMGSVVAPEQDLRMEWGAGASKLVLHIPQSKILDAAKALSGGAVDVEVKFRPTVDLLDPVHRSWYGVVRALADDVRHGGPMGSNPLLAARIADMVVLGLVANQSDPPLDTIAHSSNEIDSIEHAVGLLERHPERAWRMSDLSREVQLASRKLSMAFKERVGSSPMEYLQSVRLRRAHQDLRSALPASTSVTEIALRWGFNHLGRFSARYQQTFGELPSETLRR